MGGQGLDRRDQCVPDAFGAVVARKVVAIGQQGQPAQEEYGPASGRGTEPVCEVMRCSWRVMAPQAAGRC
jgi:hypothetical protein